MSAIVQNSEVIAQCDVASDRFIKLRKQVRSSNKNLNTNQTIENVPFVVFPPPHIQYHPIHFVPCLSPKQKKPYKNTENKEENNSTPHAENLETKNKNINMDRNII